MGFKDNFLQKMDIDKLAAQVAASVQPQADAAKFDKDAARLTIRAINAQWRHSIVPI